MKPAMWLFCGLLVALSVTPSPAIAQKAGGSQAGGPQASSQGPQSTPAAGITGGTSPIESTLFSYIALAADANEIAGAIKNGRSGVFVLTTASDISTFLQWRTAIAQTEVLKRRLQDAQSNLANIYAIPKILPACAGTPAPPKVGGAPFIQGPADVATLIQTLGSITAVNETLAPSAGNMTDLPLINLIAGELNGAPVFIPSALPPAILNAQDLGNGPLGAALFYLEQARNSGLQSSSRASSLVQDWQTVSNDKTGMCSPPQVANATALVGQWTAPVIYLNAAISAADSFETSLFSGQGTTNSSAPSSQVGPGNGQPQTATPGAIPAPPLTATNPNSSPGPSPAASTQSPTSSGTALQQILAVDLLYQKLPKNGAPGNELNLANVHFVEVHSLESGGALLTKSNLFLGSRLYFSGGAVVTFAVFDSLGSAECAGVAYAYLGYVKPGDVASHLDGSGLKVALRGTCAAQQ